MLHRVMENKWCSDNYEVAQKECKKHEKSHGIIRDVYGVINSLVQLLKTILNQV